MPKGLPQAVKDNLEKCRSAAIAAVEAYNRPGPRFRTAQYVVMIMIAWTALFHAIFYRRRQRPWYRQKPSGTGHGIRYVKVDGEPKHWELAECVKQFYADQNPPERKNIEFLVGLRNKIEHRHLPELDASLYGECQSALLNLESLLVAEFGPRYALADYLAVSLQFSQLVPVEKKKAAQSLAKSAAKTVREYVEKFRGALAPTVLNSMRYSFTVYLVPKVANRASAADVAVEFVPVDEANEGDLARAEKINVLIREKHIPIANIDMFKPGQVVQELQARLPYRVNMSTHTCAWRHYKVRPASGDPHPARTDATYCAYDQVHCDYVYARAWIEMLVRELTDPTTFQTVTGALPVSKGESVP